MIGGAGWRGGGIGPLGSSKIAANSLPPRASHGSPVGPGSLASTGYSGQTPAERLITPYLDSKLGKMLLGSNLWLARLKRRSEARESLPRVDFDDFLLRVVEVWRSKGKPVYAVLSDGRRELRILAGDNRVGAALVERGRGETGRLALEAARDMRGSGTLYILREIPR